MTGWELLPDLVQHFSRYASQNGFELEEFEIEEVLLPWLERIQTPANMRGLGRVLRALNDFSQDTTARIWLERVFELPSWFLPGLGFQISLADPKQVPLFMDHKMGSGWCEFAPFYAWLFRLAQYSKDTKARSVQLIFIEHYYKTLVELTDPAFSTNSQTREQQVCAAGRLVFDARNQDFQGLVAHLTLDDLSCIKRLALRIESYCKDENNKIEQKNSNYMRSLVHFFLGDWGGGRRGNRIHRYNKMIARRFNRTQKSVVQGCDGALQELLPSLLDVLDPEGVETDDFFPLQTFIEVEGQFTEERDTKEIPDIERVFDRALNRKKNIDVTNKVRRGQNVCLQNTELLKAGDLARFIRFLQSSQHATTLAFWAMLLLGKPLGELAQLYVFDDLHDVTSGLYLDPEGNGWWSFPVSYSAKRGLDDQRRGLIVTADHVFTACPRFFISLLSGHYNGGLAPLLPDTLTAELLAKRLKKYSDHLQRGSRISLDKISSFLDRFCFAMGTVDPVVLDFSYQLALSRTRVSRSYACLEDEQRVGTLHRLWLEISQYIRAADPTIDCPTLFEVRYWHEPMVVGSTFTPSQDTCRALVRHLLGWVDQSQPFLTFPLEDIIRYHNAYVAYTTYLLMFSTGYRAVYNPLPSLSLHLQAYRLLGISDKDDSDFTHARLVCMPELLEKQLCFYAAHLAALAELLRCIEPALANTIDQLLKADEVLLALGLSDSSVWYQSVRNSRRELGPLFHFKQVNRQWHAVNLFPKALTSFLPEELRLPSNAGRHWMKSQLIKRQVEPELIDWQMGHWMTGQTPLGYYSALSHVEASRYLAPILDEMLSEVGWQAIPSSIS